MAFATVDALCPAPFTATRSDKGRHAVRITSGDVSVYLTDDEAVKLVRAIIAALPRDAAPVSWLDVTPEAVAQ